MSIKVDTVDGTATEGSDYRGIHEVFTMEPNQTELPIQVEIGEEIATADLLISRMLSVDDDQWEPDEDFFLKISLCHDQGQRAEESDVAKIGKKHIMTIK